MRVGSKQRKQLRTKAAIAAKPFFAWEASLKAQQRRETWKAVVAEFVERSSPGGLRISINDGGARPDTVFLRLMQGSALMEAR